MATVGEPNLSTTFDWNCMEGFQSLLKNIHHSYSISETNDQMKARWMESYTVSFVWILLTDLKSWWVRVVPDSD